MRIHSLYHVPVFINARFASTMSTDQLPLSYSFAPHIDAQARVIILGSMPGIRSLDAAEYYAHPQNAFWRIMASLFGIDRAWPYEERLSRLLGERVALWDVLQACQREGSLDSMIRPESEVANDFASLFARYPQLEYVYFNGSKAESFFNRTVKPSLDLPHLHYQRLPSTSPAHAAMSFERKLAAWQIVKDSVRSS